MTSNEQLSDQSGYRWVILVLAWLVYFAFGLILTSIPPLVNIIAADLSLTYSEMGIILGSVILMYIPLAIPIGVGIDRIGLKKMIALGLLFISSSAVLRSFVFNFESLFLMVFLFGFGGPTISVGLAKVAASFFDGRERGIASGIYMTGAVVGSASAFALTNSIFLPLVGTWRNVFSLYGLFGFVIAICWIILAREPSEKTEQISRMSPVGMIARSLLGNRHIWMVALIGSSSFLVFYGFGNWLPTLLERKGLDPVYAGYLASIPTWTGLIGSAAIPGLSKVGKRRPVIVGLLSIVGITICLVGISEDALLLVSLILHGIFSGAIMPLMLVVMMDLPAVGADNTGIASGLFFSIGASMGFIGPIIVGYLTDLTSSFMPALLLLTIVVLIMIVPTIVLRED